MKYELTLANATEIDKIITLYRRVIDTTFTTWGKDYPSKELLINDIKNNNLYLLKLDDNIVAVSFLGIKENDDESWVLPLSKPMSVARICVSPDFQSKGVGTMFMSLLTQKAKELGADGMHFHVCTKNPAAIKMYENVGFSNTGLGKSNYGFDFYKYEQIFKK